jgi:hypothetical protein
VDQKNFSERYPQFVKRTITYLPQPGTEFILSYKAKSLNLPAGIAGDRDIAKPTKLASCFLLQNLLCLEQNYANYSAAARSFITFSRGAANCLLRRSTFSPK